MSQTETATGTSWIRDISRYQWMVFLIAWLGWSLDVTDFNLFALVLRPALTELLGGNPPLSEIGRVGGLLSMAGLLGWLWMGERVAGRTWAAMGVALLGSAIMVSRYFYAEAAAGSIGGDLLAFTVALAFAMATVILRRNRHVRMLPAAALAAALEIGRAHV